MKNVYDILVNFKKRAYEFYEWNKEDDIEHIKVIPSFKVSSKCLCDFINYRVKVDEEFLSQIYGKSETFNNHLIKTIDYACILHNDDVCLAVEFNSDGNLIGKSRLLFDEEEDVISQSSNLDETTLSYIIEDKTIIDKKYTRKELNTVSILERYLDNLYNKKEEDEIKYMYFECFDLMEEDIKKAYDNLKISVKEANLVVIERLRTLIKVLKK